MDYARILIHVGVLDYRLKHGIPATRAGDRESLSAKDRGSTKPSQSLEDRGSTKPSQSLEDRGSTKPSQCLESENGVNDSNPFASVLSGGESSDEGEGEESNEHPYSKQQAIFIEEAANRCTTLDQHCMCMPCYTHTHTHTHTHTRSPLQWRFPHTCQFVPMCGHTTVKLIEYFPLIANRISRHCLSYST